MINHIKNIIKEVKNGENLDLYLTITLSVIVAVLGIIGITQFQILSAAILAVLGLLANSLLANRRNTSNVKDATNDLRAEIQTLKSNFLSLDNPSIFLLQKGFPDFSQEFHSATRISILGASLHSTTIRYYSDYEKALRRGAYLRVIASEPSPNLLEMLAFRTYALKDSKLLGRSIKDHLSLFQGLSSLSSGKCETKTIGLVIPFGLVIIENSDGTAKIFVKMMAFRTPGSEYPVFKINNQNNKEWFDFFYNQFEMLWNAGDTKQLKENL